METGNASAAADTWSLAELAQASPLGFTEAMKLLRVRSGLSARALATKCGLSPSYVSKVEAGAMIPSADSFAKIVTQLRCSQAEIVFLIGLLSK